MAEDRRTLPSLDGSRDRRNRSLVLQEPVLGTADGERRNRPGIRSLLLQIPEASMSEAEARLSRRPLGSHKPKRYLAHESRISRAVGPPVRASLRLRVALRPPEPDIVVAAADRPHAHGARAVR